MRYALVLEKVSWTLSSGQLEWGYKICARNLNLYSTIPNNNNMFYHIASINALTSQTVPTLVFISPIFIKLFFCFINLLKKKEKVYSHWIDFSQISLQSNQRYLISWCDKEVVIKISTVISRSCSIHAQFQLHI